MQNRFLVVCATLCAGAPGFKVVRETSVDAIPDLRENQEIVFTEWSARTRWSAKCWWCQHVD